MSLAARVVVALVLLGVLGEPADAIAQGEPASATGAAYARASELDRQGHAAAARAAWAEVASLAAGTRMASRAERRLAWLDERAEGDFVPLEQLLTFRGLDDRDVADVSAFATEVEAMPAGRVRTESLLALAQAYAVLGDTERATATYRSVIDQPGVHEDEARLARDELAGALADGGRVTEALDELERAGMETSGRHAVLMRAARRQLLEPVAWALIALFAVLVVVGTVHVRGTRRAREALRDPWALATTAAVALGPYAVARMVGDESLDAFAALGLANAVGLLLAFAAGGAFRGAPPHAVRALSVVALLAALSAGYLSVVHFAPSLPFA